jgi:hypothetical protein
MRHPIPPDRDPILRHALSLDRTGQQAVIAALYGADSVLTPRVKPDTEFTPHGGTMGRTPKGALSYRPQPMPPSLMGFDVRELTIEVDHQIAGRRHMPRNPKDMRTLQRAIDHALPYRGRSHPAHSHATTVMGVGKSVCPVPDLDRPRTAADEYGRGCDPTLM